MSQIIFQSRLFSGLLGIPDPEGPGNPLFRPLAAEAGNERFPVLLRTMATGLRCALARQTCGMLSSISSAFCRWLRWQAIENKEVLTFRDSR